MGAKLENLGEEKQYTIDYIKSLTKKNVKIYGTEMACYTDEKKDITFLIKPDGEIGTTPIRGIYKSEQEANRWKKDPEPIIIPTHQDEPNDQPEQTELEEDNSNGSLTDLVQKWKKPIVIASVVLLLFLGTRVVGKIRKQSNSSQGAATQVEETQTSAKETALPADSQTEPTTAPEAMIMVLVAKTDMLPGQMIRKVDLKVEQVEESRYYNLAASGEMYKEADIDSILGMYVNTYLPAGEYVRHADVEISYGPVNPWQSQGSQMALSFPVSPAPGTLQSYIPGTKIDLLLTVESEQRTEGEAESTQVITPNTYELKAAVITDARSKEEDSLFNAYYRYSCIPAAYLTQALQDNLEDIQTMIPVEIEITLSAEQAESISHVDMSNAQITVSNPIAAAENQLQKITYEQIQNVVKIVERIWEE